MALQGKLEEFGLGDIFQLIAIQRKTGVLSLKDDSDDVTVYFRGGDVVFADSRKRNVEDRLGRLMQRSGMISAAVLEQALRKQKQTLQRLGRILVDDGHITQEDLDEALELQVAQVVYRLFRWQVGDYCFLQSEELDLDPSHATQITAQHLLLEGVRMIDEWPMLERKITSMQMIFEKVDETLQVESLEEGEEVELLSGQQGEEDGELLDGFGDLDVLAGFGDDESPSPPVLSSAKLDAEEILRLSAPAAQLYQFVDGKSTVENLVDCTLLGEFGTCRALYELLQRKAIHAVEVPVPTPAPTSPQPEEDAPLPAAWPDEAQPVASASPALEPAALAPQPAAAPRRRLSLLPLGYLALILAALASLATMTRNPLNLVPVSLDQSPTVDAFRRLVSRNRVDRVDRALYVYFLENQRFAASLTELVGAGVLPADAIVDPWGREYSYLVLAQGYRVLGFDNGGVEDASLSRTRRFPTGVLPPP